MRLAVGKLVALSISIGSVFLGGCAVVDQFNGRAIQYNDQASEAKRSTILLNVLRAAYAEPLQFTDVSTVTGLSTISAQPSASIPFPLNAVAAAAARSATFSPSLTMSGQNTVNVGNLNTQEFYFGLQTPISMQQVAYYVRDAQNGLKPSQLLPLFISEIEVVYKGKTYILRNRGDDQSYFYAFYYALDAMLAQGLTVEPTDQKTTTIGPALTESEAKDPKLLAALIGATATPPTLKEQVENVDGKPTVVGYRLQRQTGGGYRFCFRNVERPYQHADFTVAGRPSRRLVIPLGYADGRPIEPINIEIGQQYYCGAKSGSASQGGRNSAAQGLTLTTRSLEGIIYFLGEMVRTELGLGTGIEKSLDLQLDRSGNSYRLFGVDRRLPTQGEPWVLFRGQAHAIAVDPSGSLDTSSRILQLLTDLLALQSSAKSLPAPNVIAVTSP